MPALHRVPRLFHQGPLHLRAEVSLTPQQVHYLKNVLRLGEGDAVRLFNAENGEWCCTIDKLRKHEGVARCDEKLADPTLPPDIDYVFAPLKSARLDYVAQKATEMGARRLRPVVTRHTVVRKVNRRKVLANAIEAAEQCNLVFVPEVCEAQPLEQMLAHWDENRRIVYGDEAAPVADPIAALHKVPCGPLAVLVGPEGGFAPEERNLLRRLPFVHAIRLGPRIMRADTAGVAMLALVQAVCGDWK